MVCLPVLTDPICSTRPTRPYSQVSIRTSTPGTFCTSSVVSPGMGTAQIPVHSSLSSRCAIDGAVEGGHRLPAHDVRVALRGDDRHLLRRQIGDVYPARQ